MAMKVIGITGPTGAGKTTALRALENLGVEVLDTDRIYHRLLEESMTMTAALVAAFGRDILDEKGRVERKKLAEAVYPDGLARLNAVTHPIVVGEVDAAIALARRAGRSVAIDAIALVESGLAERCDVVVSVLAPLELRVKRIMARDGIDEAYARRRALAQQGDDFFRAHSHYVLENSEQDTPAAFEARARELFEEILG